MTKEEIQKQIEEIDNELSQIDDVLSSSDEISVHEFYEKESSLIIRKFELIQQYEQLIAY